MLELIAVAIILLVLMAIGYQSIGGSRSSGGHALAVASARAYEQAIDRFAASHGGRVPAVGDDWKTDGDAGRGPFATVMGEKQYYLRGAPESIQSGHVLLGVGRVPGGPQPSITYMLDGAGYRIEVRTTNRPVCAIYGQGGARSGAEPAPCGEA